MAVLDVRGRRSNSRRRKVCLDYSYYHGVENSDMRIGRWPEKSVKFITRLLKNAEANADAKSLEVDDLVIKNIGVQQAPVC
jgi:ribosomal protein L22